MEKPESVEAYFASLEPSRRAPLQKLRETIAAAVPRAEEGITYGMPGFLLDGRGLVGYMGFDRHYSFFPMSPAAIDAQCSYNRSTAGICGTARRCTYSAVGVSFPTREACIAPRT